MDIHRNTLKVLLIGTIGLAAGLCFLPATVKILREKAFEKTLSRVESILDENKDGYLSNEEVRRFYDEMGISPYTPDNLKHIPQEYLEEFISRYSH